MSALAAAVVSALVGAGLAAAPASAGTTYVYSCTGPNGAPVTASAWTPGSWNMEPQTVHFDNCSTGRGFGVRIDPGAHRGHAHRNYRFDAPADTTVRTVQLVRESALTEWATWQIFSGTVPYYDSQHLRHVCRASDGCRSEPRARVTFNMADASGALILVESCAVDSGCTGGQGHLTISEAVVTLSDLHPPTWSDRSGTLMQPGPKTGVVSLTASASDRGTGIYRIVTRVDGVVVDDRTPALNGGQCQELPGRAFAFSAAQPCPLSVGVSTSVDTRTLRDGTHSVHIALVDAAGNESVLWQDTIQTSNAPISTTEPEIVVDAGELKVGARLTATTGGWDPERPVTTTEYQWLRCPVDATDVRACAAIAGATAADYTPTAEDAYGRLAVRVRAINTGGQATAWSQISGIVADEAGHTDPLPRNTVAAAWADGSSVSQPKPGDELQIDPKAWVGPGPIAFEYRFLRCKDGSCVEARASGTSPVYRVTDADVGAQLVGEVTASNAHGSTTAQTGMTGAVVPRERSGGQQPTPKPPVDPPAPPLPQVPNTNPGQNTKTGVPNGQCEGGRARLTAVWRGKKGSTTTVRWGRGGKLELTLVCASTGKPISGARLAVAVSQAGANKAKAKKNQPVTNAQGRAVISIGRGASRSIAIGWRPDSLASSYAAQTTAVLRVRPKITFKVTPRAVRRDQPAKLTGRVAGARKGLVLNVQAKDGRKWRTFDQIRVKKNGRFAYTYRFKVAQPGARFHFRVQIVRGQRRLTTLPGKSKAIGVRIR